MLSNEIKIKAALSPDQLKRDVLPSDFNPKIAHSNEKLTSIVGQERAETVMKFGLRVNQKGYNIYVAGNSGVGKTTFTNTLINEFAKEDAKLFDWCYVYNFDDSYRPKMLQLPVGMGKHLQSEMEQLLIDLHEDLPKAFNEESYQKERSQIIKQIQQRSNHIVNTIDAIAKEDNFVIRMSGRGFVTVPLVDGKPITEEQYKNLDKETLNNYDEQSSKLQEKIYDHMKQLRAIESELKATLVKLEGKTADSAISYHIDILEDKFKECQHVIDYLTDVKADIIKHLDHFLIKGDNKQEDPLMQLQKQSTQDKFSNRYVINLLVDNSETIGAPVIHADNPNYYNLIGKAEYESRMGVMSTDFTKIKPGYLHHANGGYLIIQAKDVFSKNYAWESLKHTLLNDRIQIENIGEHAGLLTTVSLKPDPVPLDVKVILIGNFELYQLLYQYEEDFSKLFKVKVDFDTEMKFNDKNINNMARFIHTHCQNHNLLPFDDTAVAQVVEYSVRLVANQEKLSTQFNQLVEIIYEADTWAKMAKDQIVTERHVLKAIKEREYRLSLYEEKIQENINQGSILIDTDGFKMGQVNGLSVYQMGQYSFGRPSRITATTFIGRQGIVNIERESKMSGNIHNKGVYILSGYLGQMFAQKTPLSLTANIAFEQSYGGIDGDSASAAELYAILSSLADLPLDQGLAVTGSVNQKGMIQPIGGVNEKIEGFFEVCKQRGLTGRQGVLIPPQNVRNLMLSDEVIEAIKNGSFHIYQVHTIEEGIEILTGMPAGKADENKEYAANTVYKKVADKLNHFAKNASNHTK